MAQTCKFVHPVTGMSHWPVLCSQVLDLICVLQQWFLIIRNGVIQKERPPTTGLNLCWPGSKHLDTKLQVRQCFPSFSFGRYLGEPSYRSSVVPSWFWPSQDLEKLCRCRWGHRLPCPWYQGLVHGTCGSLASLGVVSKNRGGWKPP